MPITKNAKKALRISIKRKAVNDLVKKGLRESVKNIEKLVVEKKWKEAKAILPKAYSAIDKAMKNGVLKKNTAARKKSRLSRITKENK